MLKPKGNTCYLPDCTRCRVLHQGALLVENRPPSIDATHTFRLSGVDDGDVVASPSEVVVRSASSRFAGRRYRPTDRELRLHEMTLMVLADLTERMGLHDALLSDAAAIYMSTESVQYRSGKVNYSFTH